LNHPRSIPIYFENIYRLILWDFEKIYRLILRDILKKSFSFFGAFLFDLLLYIARNIASYILSFSLRAYVALFFPLKNV